MVMWVLHHSRFHILPARDAERDGHCTHHALSLSGRGERLHLVNMGVLLVFIFSDAGSKVILRTHRQELQWRTVSGRKDSNSNTFLYILCQQLCNSFRDMGYGKPECRPEFESLNGVVSALDVYIGELLENMDRKPRIAEYVSTLPGHHLRGHLCHSILDHLRFSSQSKMSLFLV